MNIESLMNKNLTNFINEERPKKTSLQWWNEIKQDQKKLNNWLQRQCYGEKQAHIRILALSEKFDNPVLKTIAQQELKHHEWLKEYLTGKGIPLMSEHEERYWNKVNTAPETIDQLAAVGYHAELMRLERINIIAKETDSRFGELAMIFQRISKEESFHVAAFDSMTNEQQKALATHDHEAGMMALGLVL